MALTREFKVTIKEKADRDPEFRVAMLQSAATDFLNGETESGRLTLRDYVKATIGFEELARQMDLTSSSVKRMLGPKGNPSTKNLGVIFAHLQAHEGVTLGVVNMTGKKAELVR